ncbi:lipase 3 [Stomoxys calcitrans]|uniref:lipase 3 n=1 Tax=Stomoxys calcitrans TaxID=35570 RepID=UPI0027E2BFF7|nr:lipase 3 [Stomoxys calcitrans]
MKALFIISLLIIPLLLIVFRPEHKPNTLTTLERVERAGYACKTYEIFTKDGYGLSIFRIGNSKANRSGRSSSTTTPQSKPVVLLMHGITSSSDVWVIEGLANPLAYDLVDQGYDVWLGNSRGNAYGLRHLNMSSEDRQFWRFTFHEIGTIDLPDIIDFILKQTHETSLHYVGYSQGTSIGFVLLSTQPQYNMKFKTINMLAPVVYINHIRTVLKHLAGFVGTYTPLYPFLSDLPMFGSKILRYLLGIEACRSVHANPTFCAFIVHRLFGGYSGYMDKSILPDLFNSQPTTCSLHQALHFLQLYHSKQFLQYDLGPEGNQRRYNQSTPPLYNLSNINPRYPIHLFYSDYDEYSSKKDAEALAEILGNRSATHFIDLEHFAHVDFVWGSNIKEVINKPILEIINAAEKNSAA